MWVMRHSLNLLRSLQQWSYYFLRCQMDLLQFPFDFMAT